MPADFLQTEYLVMLDLTFALLVLSMVYVSKNKPIPRFYGYLFVASYLAYMVWLYMRSVA
jgi:hypothetical protein